MKLCRNSLLASYGTISIRSLGGAIRGYRTFLAKYSVHVNISSIVYRVSQTNDGYLLLLSARALWESEIPKIVQDVRI